MCCCCCCIALVVSDSVRPQGRQPTRLPCPWDSPGKNTGVGCHFLLQCMKVKSESEVAQSCPTLRDPMDCSLHPWDFPGNSTGVGAIAFSNQCNSSILQTRMILELQNILHSKYELSLYFIPFTLCPCKVNKQTNTKQPHTQLVPQPENWEWKDLTSFKAHKSMAKHTHTHTK